MNTVNKFYVYASKDGTTKNGAVQLATRIAPGQYQYSEDVFTGNLKKCEAECARLNRELANTVYAELRPK